MYILLDICQGLAIEERGNRNFDHRLLSPSPLTSHLAVFSVAAVSCLLLYFCRCGARPPSSMSNTASNSVLFTRPARTLDRRWNRVLH